MAKRTNNRGALRVYSKRGSVQRFLREEAMRPQRACLLWPFATTHAGYGVFRVNGRYIYAHRLVCKLFHGPAPKGTEVAHSCGTPSCVNGRHLRWATSKANKEDLLLANAGIFPTAKLTPKQVIAIRKSTKPVRELMQRFDVSRGTIYQVRRNVTWRHLNG